MRDTAWLKIALILGWAGATLTYGKCKFLMGPSRRPSECV